MVTAIDCLPIYKIEPLLSYVQYNSHEIDFRFNTQELKQQMFPRMRNGLLQRGAKGKEVKATTETQSIEYGHIICAGWRYSRVSSVLSLLVPTAGGESYTVYTNTPYTVYIRPHGEPLIEEHAECGCDDASHFSLLTFREQVSVYHLVPSFIIHHHHVSQTCL